MNTDEGRVTALLVASFGLALFTSPKAGQLAPHVKALDWRAAAQDVKGDMPLVAAYGVGFVLLYLLAGVAGRVATLLAVIIFLAVALGNGAILIQGLQKLTKAIGGAS